MNSDQLVVPAYVGMPSLIVIQAGLVGLLGKASPAFFSVSVPCPVGRLLLLAPDGSDVQHPAFPACWGTPLPPRSLKITHICFNEIRSELRGRYVILLEIAADMSKQ